jgi:hypothetical protein
MEKAVKMRNKLIIEKESINKRAIQEDLRFDTDARVEIWVDRFDIEYHSKFNEIMKSGKTDEEKKEAFLEIAVEIAYDKISEMKSGIVITADINADKINVNRIDWIAMFEDFKESEV